MNPLELDKEIIQRFQKISVDTGTFREEINQKKKKLQKYNLWHSGLQKIIPSWFTKDSTYDMGKDLGDILINYC